MSTRTPRTRRALAAAAATGMVGACLLPAAALAAGDGTAKDAGSVDVVNTETVQVYLDAAGKQQSARIYEQLTLTGDGTATVRNPVEGGRLRNLDGFAGTGARKGVQEVRATVDGEERFRTVDSYTGRLPLTVEATYTLDGEKVSPGDLVGRSGRLEVDFHVVNRTAQPQQVQVADGRGGTTTETVPVAIPMVGSLTTTAPRSFRNVSSDQANVAGDGKGGTKLSFTMTLFAPIGAPESRFGYSADIEDGVVPRVDISALPVDPLASPTFASAAESYQGGADTGARLVDGATQIDSNLLKLRDGSQELLAGLIKLRDGADQLSDGLEAKAVPGSRTLADGAAELDAGAGRLAAGSKKLAAGAGTADAGGKKLASGLQQISGGLGKLKQVDGLPAAAEGINLLKAGVDRLSAGLGDPSQPETLIGGLTLLGVGLDSAAPGSATIRDGLARLNVGLPRALGGVRAVKGGLDGALAQGGGLDQLAGGLQLLDTSFCATSTSPAQCSGLVAKLQDGVKGSRKGLTDASGGLDQVIRGEKLDGTGLAFAADGVAQLAPGAADLAKGLAGAQAGAARLLKGAKDAKVGAGQLRGGLDQLAIGLTKAIDGVLQLSTGAIQAASGSQDLSSGLGRLDDGAEQLADGSGRLADGTGRLSAGADELADGLGTAGSGAQRLADGLGTAAGKAPQLPEGAQRLSTEGTSQLVAAGESTTTEYSEKVAVMQAGAERAHAEGMAVGAPEGAIGRTAYTYVLLGENGQGERNLTRAAGGGVAAAAAGGLLWWRRRSLL